MNSDRMVARSDGFEGVSVVLCVRFAKYPDLEGKSGHRLAVRQTIGDSEARPEGRV